jgi:ubiquinone/menaquinone biosynthesis C-methylase UbiE
MNLASVTINEQQAAIAFSRQSSEFDELFSGNPIVQYKRWRVRKHLLQYLSAGNFVLELNSGTGEDAIWMANHNYRVHATDISIGMQQILVNKVNDAHLENNITNELCSFTQLQKLQQKGPYNMIFSNFAGLNCTGELDKVLDSFSPLLKPGGVVTLVLMPKFCLWEFLLLFKGKFRTALRRIFARNGADAYVEGIQFKCWYYNPSYLIKRLKDEFDVLSIEGLCSLVPPSYMEGFSEKHPELYKVLQEKENKWKMKWPWKYIGDYYIISFRKKG